LDTAVKAYEAPNIVLRQSTVDVQKCGASKEIGDSTHFISNDLGDDMSDLTNSPNTGDMYRCEKCELEIHVTKGCECKDGCSEFKCCGQPMKDVTSLSVQNP